MSEEVRGVRGKWLKGQSESEEKNEGIWYGIGNEEAIS